MNLIQRLTLKAEIYESLPHSSHKTTSPIHSSRFFLLFITFIILRNLNWKFLMITFSLEAFLFLLLINHFYYLPGALFSPLPGVQLHNLV